MKNTYMEHKKKQHLLHGKGQREGIYLPHCYEHPKSMTYWDDFFFWHAGIRYSICFTHPRMQYKDTCDKIVWDALYPSYPKNDVSFVPHKTKKLGKSRKKTAFYTMQDSNEDGLQAWHQKLWDERAKMLVNDENGVVATPSVRVEWWKYGKGIEICVPYEIRTREEAEFFTLLVRNMYASGRLYEWVDKMKATTYNVTNWKQEQGVVHEHS